jgi:hypothetical protein
MHHRYNDIKDILSNRITYIDHVKSKENIMDLFIEGLTRQLIYYLSRRMRFEPLNMKKMS